MDRRSEQGFTLLEATIATLLLGILLAGLLPHFTVYSDINSLNEVRTGAVQAAQAQMESLRVLDVSTLPTTGGTRAETVEIGSNTYSVITRFCVVTDLCDADSRHLVVEVSSDGKTIYTLETVYTMFR